MLFHSKYEPNAWARLNQGTASQQSHSNHAHYTVIDFTATAVQTNCTGEKDLSNTSIQCYSPNGTPYEQTLLVHYKTLQHKIQISVTLLQLLAYIATIIFDQNRSPFGQSLMLKHGRRQLQSTKHKFAM